MVSIGHQVDLDANGNPKLGFGESSAFEVDTISVDYGKGRNGGKVFVTTTRLIWIPDDKDQETQAWMFANIILHAIQSEPEPCLYCQLDSTSLMEEDLGPNTELRVFVNDPDRLFQLYSAMCDCAALNPDPDAEADEEDADAFFDKFAIDPSLPLSSLSIAPSSGLADGDYDGQFDDEEEDEGVYCEDDEEELQDDPQQ